MAHNIETMFYTRVAPWHGLGVCVESAPNSTEALEVAGLDWKVTQRPIMTDDNTPIPGYRANIRQSDSRILGVVSDRYKVVQNHEAFAFTDALLGEGVTYETAGSLHGGKKIWLLAKFPEQYTIMGESVEPYLVFHNSHDGSGAIKVCMTPVRVVCQNTLNLALSSAKRTWSTIHVGDLTNKLDEAHNTLQLATKYMDKLGDEFENLSRVMLSDQRVSEYIEMLLPMNENPTDLHKRNVESVREDLRVRYFDAPDLQNVGRNAYRFICAVSDFATHAKPRRETVNYQENMFSKTIDGNPLIDLAFAMVREAA